MAATGIHEEDESLWSSTTEKIFIDILVDEVKKGNFRDGQFASSTWAEILEELRTRSKRNYSMKQVKQKFNRLRAKHRDFSELLKETGFCWDAETNIVHATKDTWKNYLREHPKASPFRKKGCEHYKLLGLIFYKSTAIRAFQPASTKDRADTDDEIELENEFLHSSAHVNIDACSSSHGDPIHTLHGSTSRFPKSTAAGSAEQRIRNTEAAKTSEEVSLAKEQRNKRVKSIEENGFSTSVDSSLSRCVRLLEDMEQINDDTYLKAVERFRDSDWREIFVNMSRKRKRAWLARL